MGIQLNRVHHHLNEAGVVATDDSKTLDDIQTLLIATLAAKHGARTPIISAMSGVSKIKARRIYKEVVGSEPVKGQMPSNPSFYISDMNRHFESIWLVQTYMSLSTPDDSHYENCNNTFLAYDLYLETFNTPRLCFDRFYKLIRHVCFSQDIQMEKCPECGCQKLSINTWNPSRVVKCAVCFLIKNDK